MATETAAPAASAPAPTAPPAPASAPAPVAPPLPKAQADSTPKPAGKVAPSNLPPKAPQTVDNKLEQLSRQILEPAETPAAQPAPKPEAKHEAKPEAKAEPAAEKSPFDGMELPANATEAQQSNFKALKTKAAEEVNRLKNEVAAARKEAETYKKATPADAADLQRIQQELREAQDRLAVFDLSSHPDFRKQYVEPKLKALATAHTLLTDNAVEGAPDIKTLLDKPRNEFSKALTEAAQKLPLFDQAEFMASAREAYRLHGEEKGALAKAGELRASLQAKAAQEARTAFEASRGEFSQKIPVLEVPEGATEEVAKEIAAYNKARENAFVQAEKYTFGQMTERQVADLAVRAAALEMVADHSIPMLQRQLKEARTLINAQNEQLKGIAAKKNPGSFASPGDAGKPQQAKSLDELAKQMLG